MCAGVCWGAELLDALCRKRVMNPQKRAAELRWDTPWPVLGENALYSTGPQTWYLLWDFYSRKHLKNLICFPLGNSHLCCCYSPTRVPKYLLQSQQLIQKATSFLVFCLPKSSRVTQFCYTPPLLADWNGSYQIQKANVGRGWLPQARWCSQYSGSRLFIKHLPSQMSTEMHNGQTWRQFLK